MNKLTLTQKGMHLLHQELAEPLQELPPTMSSRSSSLPHLASTATISQKQEVNQQLSKLGSHLTHLKQKGLQKIMLQREEELLAKAMGEALTGRREYLKDLIPALVRRTREGLRVGKIQSRL